MIKKTIRMSDCVGKYATLDHSIKNGAGQCIKKGSKVKIVDYGQDMKHISRHHRFHHLLTQPKSGVQATRPQKTHILRTILSFSSIRPQNLPKI